MSTAVPTRTGVKARAATKPAPASAPARLLQRSCACGQHTGGGECARCRGGHAEAAHAGSHDRSALSSSPERPRFARDFSRVATSGAITLGPAGSRQEAEADRFAERVSRSLDANGPEGPPAPAPAGGQGRGVMTYRGADGDAPVPIERGGDAGSSGRPLPESLQSDLEASRGRGRDLPQATRQSLQPYFEGDLRAVRVHDDANAHRMADDLGAQAFALGSDVYFGEGRYAPHSSEGRKLLLHEVAHTAQQGALAAPVVRSKPAPGTKSDLTIQSISVYVDMDIVVLGLSDGSSKSLPLEYNGKPSPGTYQVKLDASGVLRTSGGKDLGGTANAKGAILYWAYPSGIILDPSRPYWLVVVAGTPGKATSGSQAGAGSRKQAPSSTGQGEASKDKPGVGTGTKPPPTVDQPGTGTKPPPTTGKPGTTPSTPPSSTTPDPKATPTTPADAAAKLKALPDSIKAIMGGEGTFKPDDYDKLLRIAEKLKALESRDLELYKLVATKTTMDLDALEKSIDVFVQVKEQIREQLDAAEERKKKEKDKEPSLDEQIEQTWAGFDEKKFATLDRDQKEALARDVAAQQRNLQLKHMVTHPGETAVGMVEGVVRPDKVAGDVIDDIKEAADGNKSGFARAAGVAGATGKTAGYIAAVLGVVYIALLFIPGVNLATLGLTILVAGAIAITATAVEADLRIQAAAEAKDPQEFKTQTQKAATAQASVLVQAALMVMHLVAKLIAKIPIGGEMKTVGGALKAARAKLLTVTGVGPAAEGVRAEILQALKKAKGGLREALTRESKPLADSAARVRTMTGREFLQAVADGDPALQEVSGLTPDMARQTLELGNAPATSDIPEQVRGQVLKGLEDAPVEAAKQVDSFVNDVDQSIASVEKATTPAEIDAAAAVAEKVLSPEEASAKLQASTEGYIKARAEEAMADDRPVSKGKPVKSTPPSSDTPPKAGEAKTPAKPDDAKAPGKAGGSAKADPTEKPAMESVEREDLKQLKAERASAQTALDEARAELKEVSDRRAELDRTANEAQESIEKLEKDKARAKTPAEKSALDDQINQARRKRNAATTARKDVPTDREMTPVRNKIERLKGRIEQLDTVLDPKSTRAPLPCFASGTPVWTTCGPRAIDSLREGDRVLAYDLERQVVVERAVARFHRNRTHHFYEIGIAGRVIRATGRHPFWAEDRADWVAAADLTAGSTLKSRDGSAAIVQSVALSDGGEHDTFNLTVEGIHNFFVGPGVLVHNGAPVNLGLGDEFIYIGRNPKFPGKVYIGKSNKMKREAQHHKEALDELKNPNLSAEDKEFFEFKSEMTIEPIVEGVGGDVTPYLEQINLELEIRNRGDANVMYRRNERTPEKMKILKERIAKDPKVQELGYCPKG